MKTTRLLSVIILFGFIVISCSQSIEEKLAGEWYATEVEIDADEGKHTRERTDALRRMEKSVIFVLKEDFTVEAFTGQSSIDGTWDYNDEDGAVYILFSGSNENEKTLLGNF